MASSNSRRRTPALNSFQRSSVRIVRRGAFCFLRFEFFFAFSIRLSTFPLRSNNIIPCNFKTVHVIVLLILTSNLHVFLLSVGRPPISLLETNAVTQPPTLPIQNAEVACFVGHSTGGALGVYFCSEECADERDWLFV